MEQKPMTNTEAETETTTSQIITGAYKVIQPIRLPKQVQHTLKNTSTRSLYEFVKNWAQEHTENNYSDIDESIKTLDAALAALPDQAGIKDAVNCLLQQMIDSTVENNQPPEAAFAMCSSSLATAAIIVACMVAEQDKESAAT